MDTIMVIDNRISLHWGAPKAYFGLATQAEDGIVLRLVTEVDLPSTSTARSVLVDVPILVMGEAYNQGEVYSHTVGRAGFKAAVVAACGGPFGGHLQRLDEPLPAVKIPAMSHLHPREGREGGDTHEVGAAAIAAVDFMEQFLPATLWVVGGRINSQAHDRWSWRIDVSEGAKVPRFEKEEDMVSSPVYTPLTKALTGLTRPESWIPEGDAVSAAAFAALELATRASYWLPEVAALRTEFGDEKVLEALQHLSKQGGAKKLGVDLWEVQVWQNGEEEDPSIPILQIKMSEEDLFGILPRLGQEDLDD